MSRPNAAFPRGVEWVEGSHWIPDRYKWVPSAIRDSSANIKLMWGEEHALADPCRYQFLRKWWKTANHLPPVAAQQWNRMPGWAQGAAVGGAYAGASGAKVKLGR